ncbi:uncharacterized protein LOC124153090 [Haliotis rufescens]|uniref:uncharacterized protein LOC124153090 n=1 Tax=Haliotis rufescens TaxID=6454 RepID=UPI00201E8451|nr:uncharacterized protein LOC124153090 [Haliotis rufescens]XP_046382190.2 uncharacterized protein LOC124153090 [Haliotis rufescens]
MSDESHVQEKASKVLGDDPLKSQIKVDRKEFAKLLHQVLAYKNLAMCIQSIAGENKKLKQRNEDLERTILKSNRKFSQMVIQDNQGSRSSQVKLQENRSRSLPSHFNFDDDFNLMPSVVAQSQSFSSLQHQRNPDINAPKISLDKSVSSSQNPSSLFVSNLGASVLADSAPTWYSTDRAKLKERGIVHGADSEADQEKTDPCKDEETGYSLKVDGDCRSLNVAPQFVLPTHFKPTSPVSPSLTPPSLSLSSDEQDPVVGADQPPLEEVHVACPGVSRQYFDVVVKELAKSKQLIKQLIAKSRENPNDVMDTISMKQMAHSLAVENQRLKESNLYFRNLLVREATSEDVHAPANAEILNFHDKVQKLERQLTLKNTALEQLNKQCEIWKRYGQKAMAAQYTAKKDERPLPTPTTDNFSQTEMVHVESRVSQTEGQDVSRQSQAEEEAAAMLTESQLTVQKLERLVGDVTMENMQEKEKMEMLTAHYMNLEQSYKQVLENMAELERNQDAAETRGRIKALERDIEDKARTLKDNTEEMKFLRYQIQSAQSDMGTLSQQKTRAEAMLKSQQERASQKETQLFTQCSRLQQQVYGLLTENEKLTMRLSAQTNVARVQPVMQQISQEPTSMPVMSYKAGAFPWQRGPKDVSLLTNSEVASSDLNYSDPCLLKRQLSSEEEKYLCHHCLRTDFKDEKSFNQHMQRCGD